MPDTMKSNGPASHPRLERNRAAFDRLVYSQRVLTVLFVIAVMFVAFLVPADDVERVVFRLALWSFPLDFWSGGSIGLLCVTFGRGERSVSSLFGGATGLSSSSSSRFHGRCLWKGGQGLVAKR